MLRMIMASVRRERTETPATPPHGVGAEVLYRRLVGCEAQIIGFSDRTIIYVSDGTQPRRRRGDELGYWHHYRGQSFVCRSEDIGRPTIRRVEEYGRRRIWPGKRAVVAHT
jgi:hypothetical protein